MLMIKYLNATAKMQNKGILAVFCFSVVGYYVLFKNACVGLCGLVWACGYFVNTKEYLNKINELRIVIAQRETQIKELKMSLLRSKELSHTSSKGNVSYSDPMKIVDKYMDMEKELSQIIFQREEEKNKIIGMIQGIDNILYEQILYKKYVENKNLYDISKDLGYEYKYISKKHNDALKEFQNKYGGVKNGC